MPTDPTNAPGRVNTPNEAYRRTAVRGHTSERPAEASTAARSPIRVRVGRFLMTSHIAFWHDRRYEREQRQRGQTAVAAPGRPNEGRGVRRPGRGLRGGRQTGPCRVRL